jgi:lipoprotein NlpD
MVAVAIGGGMKGRLMSLLAVLVIAACAGAPPAPVEERSTRPVAMPLEADGRYRVRRGDTLFAIAFSYGLDYREMAGWNGIRSPYVIYPDQLVRLQPPEKKVSTKPLRTPAASKPVETQTKPAPVVTKKPASTPSSPPSKPQPKTTSATPVSDPDRWVWPTQGRIYRTFKANDSSRKGIEIAGTEGQSIRAVAAGTVVYSGSGLIGYGELIIIKHSETLLSAYAHNRMRLVKEGAKIKSGQNIAEMGRKGSTRALLHFEIRRNGQPVDPMKYLPKQKN